MSYPFIAYCIIPLTTLLLAGDSQWLTTNFSLIGSQGWHRFFFLLWGVSVGLYFHRCLGLLIPTMGGHPWLERGRHLSLLLFLLALTIPYRPQSTPFYAWLHVLLALISVILLFFLVLSLLLTAQTTAPTLARPYLLVMAVIGAITAFLLAIAGIVSTALEVFLVLSNVLLLQRMQAQQWS